ncbi:MAG: TrkA family potassium uptake protein [Theionarchaea archaeon]|nr:MAG: potassium transporter TrkA [Theionarchaea archaeon DG-70-1]MBU7026338.1 TrkA family potassium uptake protein [Theionarchaea archaeon]
MKQFVVIGLGSFGFNLAVALSREGHEVLVIDRDEKKIDAIKERVTHAVVADAADKKVLSELVSTDVDTVIVGLDESIEGSTLVTLYLRDLGVKELIVKTMSDDHAKILRAVGAAEIVYPEKDAAIRLAERLSTPNLIEHLPLTSEYSIVEIKPPNAFLGKPLKELPLRKEYGIVVIAVKDVLTNTFQLIPGSDFEIKPNSALVIIGKTDDIDKLRTFIE